MRQGLPLLASAFADDALFILHPSNGRGCHARCFLPPPFPRHAAVAPVAELGVVRRFCACPEIGKGYSPHMIQTIEAIVDERGAVRLLEPLRLDRRHRALVTILADEPSDAHETALLSEASLAEDWNRPEEDAAWSHLQQVP